MALTQHRTYGFISGMLGEPILYAHLKQNTFILYSVYVCVSTGHGTGGRG